MPMSCFWFMSFGKVKQKSRWFLSLSRAEFCLMLLDVEELYPTSLYILINVLAVLVNFLLGWSLLWWSDCLVTDCPYSETWYFAAVHSRGLLWRQTGLLRTYRLKVCRVLIGKIITNCCQFYFVCFTCNKYCWTSIDYLSIQFRLLLSVVFVYSSNLMMIDLFPFQLRKWGRSSRSNWRKLVARKM